MINFGDELSSSIPKAFLLDFEERVRAAGKQAKDVTRDLEMAARSRPRVAGQIRTAIVERMLVQAAAAAGFTGEESGLVAPEVYVHQSFVRLNRAIAVRATLSGTVGLPATNKSRKRLVEKINARYSPDLFRSEVGSKSDPIAVFLVVTPDRAAIDGVGGVSVCVVDDRYDHYLFNESLEVFLARYAKPAETKDDLILKRRAVGTYPAPEHGAVAKSKKETTR